MDLQVLQTSELQNTGAVKSVNEKHFCQTLKSHSTFRLEGLVEGKRKDIHLSSKAPSESF